MELTPERIAALDASLPALAKFKQAFGRDATPGFVAELLAAREYGLTLLDDATAHGADARDGEGKRYQIKCRTPDVLNVDINNFEFDFIVLVNLDAEYQSAGMWRLAAEQVKPLCTWREKFRKFQVTQARFKTEASHAQA